MLDLLSAISREFLRDEQGAEVTELAVVLALIVAGAVGTIALIGPIIHQYYTDVHTALAPAP